MNLLDIALIFAVAIPIGILAHLTSAYSRKGWIFYIGLAFLGGFIGTSIAYVFPVPTVYLLKIQSNNFPIIWTLMGSVLTVAALGFFIKPRMR